MLYKTLFFYKFHFVSYVYVCVYECVKSKFTFFPGADTKLFLFTFKQKLYLQIGIIYRLLDGNWLIS